MKWCLTGIDAAQTTARWSVGHDGGVGRRAVAEGEWAFGADDALSSFDHLE